MRIRFMELVDTVARSTSEGIGYAWRLVGDGALAAKREATAYSLPGIFFRPGDADEDVDGTEDCAVLEDGDERNIIGTRNATAWQKLLAYLGREFDRGELVFSRSDGTNRCTIHLRPNGDVIVKADDGSTKTVVATWDASTGNLDLEPSGEVRVGGASAIEYATLADALRTQSNVNVTAYAGHTHGGAVAAPTAFLMVPITTAIRSTKLRHH